MRVLIIGDVHGCLNTLKALLEENWKQGELLIFLGDLIDRGCYTPETVEYVRNLQKKYPDCVQVLLGNHENEFIEHFDHGPNQNWLWQTGTKTLQDYEEKGYDLFKDLAWFKTLPLFYETDSVFVSHAGISAFSRDPYDLNNPESIIWNRSKKKAIGKMQVIGHTPNPNGPSYDKESNTWNIDTAAVYGAKLTAMRLDEKGGVREIISISVFRDDLFC